MLKYFKIESVKIACWVNNSDYDARRQSLVFIHGSGGNHSVWSHQYGRLHKKYNIAAINLPGHGHSGGSGEADVADYCLWIKKLLDILDMKSAVLVGHSLGAAIALRFAINYSQEVAGIVCLGGGMKMPVNSFFLEFLKTNPAEVPAEVIDLICKLSLAKENRSKFSAPLRKSISQSKVDVLYGDLSACNDLNLTQETGKISVPALIICGAEDKMTPPDLSRALVAGISKATLEIIEGAGHMVMLERPAEFNISLDKFAASISAAFSE
ncbi:MAG: alpha/beta hydrolase [Smithella sp.]|jgi:pimeloyl-ACP methyl ester carboxylesterase